MCDTLKHGTITVYGFGYFHKNCRFLWGKKMFQKQIQEEQYTIPIHHMTNSSNFVWFQRSCGSMKSVSSLVYILLLQEPQSSSLHSLYMYTLLRSAKLKVSCHVQPLACWSNINIDSKLLTGVEITFCIECFCSSELGICFDKQHKKLFVEKALQQGVARFTNCNQ